MAEKETVPSEEDLLEYARRMAFAYETFKHIRDVLQSVANAKANTAKYIKQAEDAEERKNKAVADSDAVVAEVEARTKAVQDKSVADLARIDQTIAARHDEGAAKRREMEEQLKGLDADVKRARAQFQSAQDNFKAQIEAQRQAVEVEKIAIVKEIETLQARLDAMNQIVKNKRDAILALSTE